MMRRLGLGKNNHLTYASLALNPRDEEQIMTKQMPHTTKQNCNRGTTLIKMLVSKKTNGGGGGYLNQFYTSETSSFNLMLLQITNICLVCIGSSIISVKYHSEIHL